MHCLVKISFVVLFGTALTACAATVSLAPQTENQQAKTFEVSEQQANLYVYRRPELKGFGVLLPIYLDGQFVGGVAPGTFLFLQVNPGKHTVASITPSNQAAITLKAESQTNYFIQAQSAWALVTTARAELNQVPETEARDAIQDLSLASHIE